MSSQILKLLVPPTMRELLEDPVYARYAGRNPRIPDNVRHGTPWQIIARRIEDAPGATWALKMMPTYAEARSYVLLKIIDNNHYEDVAICSRRVLFRPPVGYVWNTSKYSWCGRCRRPSLFRETYSHHALRAAPALTYDEAYRCYYCGAREVFAASRKPRRKHDV